MKPTILNPFISAMKTELKESEGKHAEFCDELFETYEAGLIFYEKVSEALEAFSKNDYKQTLKELAKCGVVIIRMMEFVKEHSDAE